MALKLLLVEDEKRMAMALIELLRMEKYDVDHAADGLLAMEMIERGTYHGYFPFPQISEFRFKGQPDFLHIQGFPPLSLSRPSDSRPHCRPSTSAPSRRNQPRPSKSP